MQIDTRLWKKKKKSVTQRIVNSSRPLPLPPSNPSPDCFISPCSTFILLLSSSPSQSRRCNTVDGPSLFPTKRWNRYANNTGGHREIRFGGDARAILRLSIASPSLPSAYKRAKEGKRGEDWPDSSMRLTNWLLTGPRNLFKRYYTRLTTAPIPDIHFRIADFYLNRVSGNQQCFLVISYRGG